MESLRKLLARFKIGCGTPKQIYDFTSPIQGWHKFSDYSKYKENPHLTFNGMWHINRSILGWPAIGRYVGLVIDESVRHEDDWKLYYNDVKEQDSKIAFEII